MPVPKFVAGFLGFFTAFRPSRVAGAAKMAVQQVETHFPGAHPIKGVDYSDGYYDRNAAPPTTGDWNRIPGGMHPVPLPAPPIETAAQYDAQRAAEAAQMAAQNARNDAQARQIVSTGANAILPGSGVILNYATQAMESFRDAIGLGGRGPPKEDEDPYDYIRYYGFISADSIRNMIQRGLYNAFLKDFALRRNVGKQLTPLQGYFLDHNQLINEKDFSSSPPLNDPPHGFGNPPYSAGTWQDVVGGLDAKRAAAAQLAMTTAVQVQGMLSHLGISLPMPQATQPQPAPVIASVPASPEPANEFATLTPFVPKGAYLP